MGLLLTTHIMHFTLQQEPFGVATTTTQQHQHTHISCPISTRHTTSCAKWLQTATCFDGLPSYFTPELAKCAAWICYCKAQRNFEKQSSLPKTPHVVLSYKYPFTMNGITTLLALPTTNNNNSCICKMPNNQIVARSPLFPRAAFAAPFLYYTIP